MMKTTITIVAAATALAVAGPVAAQGEKVLSGKELGLRYTQNCAARTENLLEKLKRLEEEIAKGRRVYTPQEIRRLEVKLKETEEMMDVLLPSDD